MPIYTVAIRGSDKKLLYLAYSDANRLWFISASKEQAEPFFSRFVGLEALASYCNRVNSNFALRRLVMISEPLDTPV